MVEQIQNEYEPKEVSAPGETLRELLAERGITQAELAARMGRPKKTISEIINGKAAIIPETALQLELVLGVPASFWNAREGHYREYLARKEQQQRLNKEWLWCRRFPRREMNRFGWLERRDDRQGQVKALLEFFGVASAEQWKEVYGGMRVAFRCSTTFQVDEYALSAWLRKGELEAEETETEPYDQHRFRACLLRARGFTRDAPEVFEQALQKECAQAGVVVAFIRELPRSRASGATRWLSPSKALIQLSLRYRTDDHLWFTFFHEAAHILFHAKRKIFLEGGTSGSSRAEEEANRWAADFLIPRDAYQELISWDSYPKERLVEYAERLGIAPGILVGRLQHDEVVPFSNLNSLKRRFRWLDPPESQPS